MADDSRRSMVNKFGLQIFANEYNFHRVLDTSSFVSNLAKLSKGSEGLA